MKQAHRRFLSCRCSKKMLKKHCLYFLVFFLVTACQQSPKDIPRLVVAVEKKSPVYPLYVRTFRCKVKSSSSLPSEWLAAWQNIADNTVQTIYPELRKAPGSQKADWLLECHLSAIKLEKVQKDNFETQFPQNLASRAKRINYPTEITQVTCAVDLSIRDPLSKNIFFRKKELLEAPLLSPKKNSYWILLSNSFEVFLTEHLFPKVTRENVAFLTPSGYNREILTLIKKHKWPLLVNKLSQAIREDQGHLLKEKKINKNNLSRLAVSYYNRSKVLLISNCNQAALRDLKYAKRIFEFVWKK